MNGKTDMNAADIHHVLALLLELQTELQLGVNEEQRTAIQSHQASGKGAKLQKSLLELRTVPNSARRQQAHELALEATIARAERWSTTDERCD